MKKTSVLFVLLTFFIVSCSKEETPENKLLGDTKSISVSLKRGEKPVTAGEQVWFVVKNDKGMDVSSSSKVFVEGKEIKGLRYAFEKEGKAKVYATFGEFKSSEIVVDVKGKTVLKPGTHKARVLIHDFTGTWCPYCSDVYYRIKKLHKAYPDEVVSIAIHGQGASEEKDELFVYPNIGEYGIKGFPTVWLNNAPNNTIDNQIIDELIKEKKTVGLSVNYNSKEKKVAVGVHYDNFENGKLVVQILEDGYIGDQANYYNNDPSSEAYKKGRIIKGLVHDNVLRASLTKTLGNVIPEKEVKDNVYTKEFSFGGKKIGIKNVKNTKVVAYFLDRRNRVVNVKVAKAGENKKID